eukprot:Rhum_TRINITY_DN11038_c0_g2::Rhum_TRINITY_DN11038_c0_g2_i1::g.41723::m.41723
MGWGGGVACVKEGRRERGCTLATLLCGRSRGASRRPGPARDVFFLGGIRLCFWLFGHVFRRHEDNGLRGLQVGHVQLAALVLRSRVLQHGEQVVVAVLHLAAHHGEEGSLVRHKEVHLLLELLQVLAVCGRDVARRHQLDRLGAVRVVPAELLQAVDVVRKGHVVEERDLPRHALVVHVLVREVLLEVHRRQLQQLKRLLRVVPNPCAVEHRHHDAPFVCVQVCHLLLRAALCSVLDEEHLRPRPRGKVVVVRTRTHPGHLLHAGPSCGHVTLVQQCVAEHSRGRHHSALLQLPPQRCSQHPQQRVNAPRRHDATFMWKAISARNTQMPMKYRYCSFY